MVRVREAPLEALHADDVVVPLLVPGVELGVLVWEHLQALGVVPGVVSDVVEPIGGGVGVPLGDAESRRSA